MKTHLLIVLSLLVLPAYANAATTFTESDFYFGKTTKPYKDIIIAGVNKLHRENPSCKEIDPGSAYISSSKGTKSNPVFFVTCGSGANMHNVFFCKIRCRGRDKNIYS